MGMMDIFIDEMEKVNLLAQHLQLVTQLGLVSIMHLKSSFSRKFLSHLKQEFSWTLLTVDSANVAYIFW